MKRREEDFHGGRGIHCLLRKLEQGYNCIFQNQKLYRAKKEGFKHPSSFYFHVYLGEKSQNRKKIEKEGLGIFHSSVCQLCSGRKLLLATVLLYRI